VALTESSELSEIILKFRDGELVQRECWSRVTIRRDGEQIAQVTLNSEPSGDELTKLLGETLAGLTRQVLTLTAERDGLRRVD